MRSLVIQLPAARTKQRHSSHVLDDSLQNMVKMSVKGGLLMAVQERKAESSFDRYIAEVCAVWGDGKDPQLPHKVAALMEKLFASTSANDPWMAQIIRDGKPSRELYRDTEHGFIQMGHVHQSGHGNTPHDHGPCWVVYGAFSGLTEITKYKRTDDGSQPGKATLVKDELHRLSSGRVK